jgi:hypothetical protein
VFNFFDMSTKQDVERCDRLKGNTFAVLDGALRLSDLSTVAFGSAGNPGSNPRTAIFTHFISLQQD